VLRLVSDENFQGPILRGLIHRLPELDLVIVTEQEGMRGMPDLLLLEWAAGEGRVVMTHDFQTMIGYAYDRVKAGLPMPGVFAVQEGCPTRLAIDELLIMILCSDDDEWNDRVVHVPI